MNSYLNINEAIALYLKKYPEKIFNIPNVRAIVHYGKAMYCFGYETLLDALSGKIEDHSDYNGYYPRIGDICVLGNISKVKCTENGWNNDPDIISKN